MTLEELRIIEARLQVVLPPQYTRIMLDYPWSEFAGGTAFSLWDDAALNVERTLEYRGGFGGAPPWPADYLHIGDDEDACPYVLRCSDGSVVKTDHGNLTVQPLARYASVQAFVDELQRLLGE